MRVDDGQPPGSLVGRELDDHLQRCGPVLVGHGAEPRAEADRPRRDLLGAHHLRVEARFVAFVGDEVEDGLRPAAR